MNRHEEDVNYKNANILINQLVFFMVCDRWFCPHEKLTCLYSLLFYNVAIYLLSYARKVFNLQEYSPVIFVSEHTTIRHLAMTTTKIVLDLTKMVTFVITGVFMMLVFGLEQGLQHFNPTWGYIVVTCIYFLITENSSQQKITSALSWFNFEIFENLEVLWGPVLLSLCSFIISLLMAALVLFLSDGSIVVVIASCYFNIYLSLKQIDNHWKTLRKERACLDKYRVATQEELAMQDDVCAVCLQSMVYARVTPCKHMFHGDCLRQCLKEFAICPMCKQEL